MRLRNITGSRDVIAGSDYVCHEPEKLRGKWKSEIFRKDSPLQIEIGMGKGRFLMTLAKLHPDISYLGIEKYSTVLLRALQKMDAEPLDNLRFIRMDAEYITDVFDEGEIDRIYLNFSDPWPKDRHAKRRLPSHQFLERYDRILKGDGVVEFKTDNKDLFDFAVEEVSVAGWKIDAISYDLHADEEMMRDNIMTEYEERFSSMGNPIYKYVISRNHL